MDSRPLISTGDAPLVELAEAAEEAAVAARPEEVAVAVLLAGLLFAELVLDRVALLIVVFLDMVVLLPELIVPMEEVELMDELLLMLLLLLLLCATTPVVLEDDDMLVEDDAVAPWTSKGPK